MPLVIKKCAVEITATINVEDTSEAGTDAQISKWEKIKDVKIKDLPEDFKEATVTAVTIAASDPETIIEEVEMDEDVQRVILEIKNVKYDREDFQDMKEMNEVEKEFKFVRTDEEEMNYTDAEWLKVIEDLILEETGHKPVSFKYKIKR